MNRYGCIVFGELTKTQLQKLNVIQNGALRTILGARKTSPITSLEVEAYVMPIEIRFQLLFAKWFCKILNSPRNDDKAEISQEIGIIPLSRENCFTIRAKWLFTDIGLPMIKRVPTSYESPVPPEIDLNSNIYMDMFESW